MDAGGGGSGGAGHGNFGGSVTDRGVLHKMVGNGDGGEGATVEVFSGKVCANGGKNVPGKRKNGEKGKKYSAKEGKIVKMSKKEPLF